MMQCFICGGKEKLGFTKHGYKIRLCSECGLFRTVLPESYSRLVQRYYNRGYFTGSRLRAGYAQYEDDRHIIATNMRRFLQMLQPYARGKNILDVGCATGILLREAQAQGYQVQGIDVSPYAVAKAREKFGDGIVGLGTLESVSFSPQSFDVITLLDVFEHFDKPRQALQKVRRSLKPNGVVVINTGDTQSMLARLQGQSWHFFIPPQHLYFYSASNLEKLLEQEGFKVLKVVEQGKRLSLRYILHLARTIDRSRLASWLYPLVCNNFLGKTSLYLNFYDNMTLIARKK